MQGRVLRFDRATVTAVKYSGDLVAPCVREYMVGRKNMCFVSVMCIRKGTSISRG